MDTKNKIKVYNHVIGSLKPEKGNGLKSIPLSSVMSVIIKDFDVHDPRVQEIYCPENVFVFGEDLEDQFLVKFTCGDGWLGNLQEFFEIFELLPVNDDEKIQGFSF